ncbi:DUF4468 domain-containing protein [Hymenobacter volaticus]|uniref:DUF4468 domain-containing protein n=1 Tax=Hymenobacter volaticus TaxID=2932254 RepID=A0ABY4GAV4_9BACT|nr:DUF4468 domain-containing protein [Hymenobacter volaticus]UOQ68031.1 DUF4468 domain-containing protein [Hymenobacter volaticus]
MKTILLSLCVLSSVVAQAQTQARKAPNTVDSAGHKVKYEGEVQVPGITRVELQNRAKNWFAAHFIDASNPLMLTDTENGSLVGKGSTRVKWAGGEKNRSHRVWFIFTLEANDGRYHYQLKDLQNQTDTTTTLAATLMAAVDSPRAQLPQPSLPVAAPTRKAVITVNKTAFSSKAVASRKKQPVPVAPVDPLQQYKGAVQEQMAEIVKSLNTALATSTAQDW